ncbi:bifunctional phosphoribosylaminoimidazole carboxylase/phosphoribosylaminoimidazole succinocarboxamide synthetase isoform X1 [Gouania willdenowi]|uniref:bifunctional phosphoribosylaminoimidazole carboxylase/phosphoribosylaminoimidazole succinocarboxamide synthetase isoform X1 n=1 Tax=Gouania willdenowi TaxID=441366 RepID=UPI001055F9D9|nr:uncharacterized protein LOC114462156 isoform X1 [Gouania willdenowi]
MAASIQTMDTRTVKGWKAEVEGVGDQKGVYNPPVTFPTQKAIYNPSVVEEGGRHWTDDEVRALLCVWANKRIRKRLKSTLRNKPIFQEMARRMEQKFGVVRNWKQCRTKYKNLKYDYKSAKNAHAAGGRDAGGPGKYMKFFEEVECILLDQGLENGAIDMQRRFYSGDIEVGKLQSPTGHTGPLMTSKREAVIEIQDEDIIDYHDIDENNEAKPLTSVADPTSSDHLQVVTVSDTGRNWSDQEVQALVHVWSDDHIRRQLESSTRKRDIFVQISSKLMQLGIERDWKQCHTKYKNLKYLYRSLQRGKTDDFDPRRIMRFYDQVDAIMNMDSVGASVDDTGAVDSRVSEGLSGIEAFRENHYAEPHVAMLDSAMVEATCLNLVSSSVHDHTGPKTIEEDPLDVNYRMNCKTGAEKRESYSTNRGMKRKAVDQDLIQTPAKKKVPVHNVGTATKSQCKEEPEHTPIIMINSVCSMASTLPAPVREPGPGPSRTTMASTPELKVGQKLNEGKTKQIFELVDEPGLVLVQSKDQITAGNAVRKDQMEGKAAIANKTTSCVFKLLQEAGINTAFKKLHSDTAFIAAHCEMIPIEWVCRRIATGSFLKRNPGVKEGFRFSPLKMEMFFKDDANNDPQWSEEQLLEAKFTLAGLSIGQCEVDVMNRSTVAIFEILEKAWATQNCTLVDMKIEFGVNVRTQEIVLADVIDNDSWRLWPAGDRSQQKDKQVYRDLKEVTPEAMQMVKRNFEWVSERVQLLLEPQASGRVVVLMGSTSDMAHCEKIRKACTSFGIPCILRVTSAHKGPDETLRIKAQYEGDGTPTVFVAVAGRSNGLGPVMSGNTAYPVINCPPITPDWGAQDVWSSLRMPSGLGCSTILSPEAAAQFAAQIFGLTNHVVWCKLRASMLNTWVSLKLADQKLQACTI